MNAGGSPERSEARAAAAYGETSGPPRASPSFTAVVHGYAYLPRGGFAPGCSADAHGLPTQIDLFAAEAAATVRALARASAQRVRCIGSGVTVPDPAGARHPADRSRGGRPSTATR
jgi:hypothetical protein